MDVDRGNAIYIHGTVVIVGSLLWPVPSLLSQLILGDSVVIWRTWVLFRDAEKYLIVPALTWIGSVGTTPLFYNRDGRMIGKC